VFFTRNPTKLGSHFSDFSSIFYAFYKIQQNGNTIEVTSYKQVPGKNLIFTDMPLNHRNDPGKNCQLAMWLFGQAGGAVAGIPMAPMVGSVGKVVVEVC
jgi:hypothetical protein